ncbi:hypothetical protein MY1884_001102 [Beauveria asiatica]|uniref:Ubiquitin carboxyl-terminal hydrolase 19 n=1 Tax=Beauveria asiatica TaxID=1069075 RepID=A0AAW0RXD4_9HYPO
MEQSFPITPEDLYNLQMEVKQVQYAQSSHAERISRLEKRQTDDLALKSVWNSPFPGVLAGTPQQGPVQIPHNDVFDDSDEQGEQLLGSLHLGPAEEEPVRRGAASRANSVRFDESALHGSGWSGAQSNRHSGDFGSRPASGIFMERTSSHKSDGRHSSAGHSIHSHHSVASGRASSVGRDTADDDDTSSFGIPEPPISLFVLGSVPSIIRCWLTTNFAHRTLLYADVCSGSQRSTISYSLLEELDLVEEIEKDVDGICRARLQVYFAEAVVTRRGRSSEGSEGLVPSMSVAFEVVGSSQSNPIGERKPVRVFIGSDALRAHCADILFSKNTMVLYGNDRDRLRVPFVRPEDDEVFRHINTANAPPEKQKLNATAAPFVLAEKADKNGQEPRPRPLRTLGDDADVPEPTSPTTVHTRGRRRGSTRSRRSTNEAKQPRDSSHGGALSGKEDATGSESSRRESSAGIWGSWRHGPSGGNDRDAASISGYQPAPARGSRGMKTLKSGKSSSSAKTGAAYEAPLPSRSDGRRKSQVSVGGESINGSNKKDAKRSVSATSDARSHASTRDKSAAPPGSRGVNPVGVASAFSWMTPGGKPKG